MADPFDAWQKTVAATLKARKRGVQIQQLDPTAVMQAFQSGMSPVAFALQANLPMRPPAAAPSPVAAGPVDPLGALVDELQRWCRGLALACAISLALSAILWLKLQDVQATLKRHQDAIGDVARAHDSLVGALRSLR